MSHPRRARALSLLTPLLASSWGCASAPAGPPAAEELASAVYKGIFEEPVRFEKGRYEGDPHVPGGAARPSAQLVEGIRETGDLDGDGIEESIVVLAENSGGTGVRVYLAVVGRRGGGVENLGTALVGDRVLIRSIFADQGMIQVDLVQQGPGDAACCPSEKAFRGWELGPEGLVEVFTDVSGTLSIAGLEGTEWILARLAWGDPAPTEPEVTLRVDGGRLTGAAGCNAYGAAVEEPAPGEISVGHVGRTKKLCPAPIMEIEERYLAAIGGAFSHRLLGGRLGLMYRDGERTETLIFTAR